MQNIKLQHNEKLPENWRQQQPTYAHLSTLVLIWAAISLFPPLLIQAIGLGMLVWASNFWLACISFQIFQLPMNYANCKLSKKLSWTLFSSIYHHPKHKILYTMCTCLMTPKLSLKRLRQTFVRWVKSPLQQKTHIKNMMHRSTLNKFNSHIFNMAKFCSPSLNYIKVPTIWKTL